MKPSKEQLEVYNTVRNTNSHVVIMAGPGSGKTTTIVNALKYLPTNASAVFIAFSNKIVKELKGRVPTNIDCSTMHSIGYNAIIDSGRSKLDDKKVFKIVKNLYKRDIAFDSKQAFSKIFDVVNSVNLIRSTCCSYNESDVTEMLSNRNITLSEREMMNSFLTLKKLSEYNDKMYKDVNVIDYQDMIELPVNYSDDYLLPRYDYVFVDEAQDTSNLDRKFIKLLLKNDKSRLVVVGDKKQAIYGFRGAEVDSMDRFIEMENTKKLSLSVSYRCASKIVDEANKVYSGLSASKNAKEGVVRTGLLEDVSKGDLVICRSTSPLVEAYFNLVSLGVNCTIVGKDIEKGLVSISESVLANTLSEVDSNCKELLESVANELIGKRIHSFKNHPRYQQMEEKVELIKILSEKYQDRLLDLTNIIESIFNSKHSDVQLMTIHKSKGLESDRVFFIEKLNGKNLIPSKYSVTDGQLIQEKNLTFVAITRAKSELIFVDLKTKDI